MSLSRFIGSVILKPILLLKVSLVVFLIAFIFYGQIQQVMASELHVQSECLEYKVTISTPVTGNLRGSPVTVNVRASNNIAGVWLRTDGELHKLAGINGNNQYTDWNITVTPHTLVPVAIFASAADNLDEPVINTQFQLVQREKVVDKLDVLSGRSDSSQTINARWNNIGIIGCDHFVSQTLAAFRYIETGPRWAFDYVVNYLNFIKQDENVPVETGGVIRLVSSKFRVPSRTYNSGNTGSFYASTIVHEAVHGRQFIEYLDSYIDSGPEIITFGEDAELYYTLEMEALDLQIKFLKAVGACERVVTHTESFIGNPWW